MAKSLLQKLEAKVNPEFRKFLLQEIPRGEALHQQAPKNQQVLKILTKMYWEMNRQLAIVCDHLRYSRRQWEWDKSEPLERLAQVFPGLPTTQWYQLHLTQMYDPKPGHPWLTIRT